MAEQQRVSFITASKNTPQKHNIPCPGFTAPFSPTPANTAGILSPLTSAPFGHDNQRRRAEQRRLAPRDPASAPPGRGRHPAGDRPDSVDHDTDGRESEYTGDIILGIIPSPREHPFFFSRCPACPPVKLYDVTARF